LTDDTCPQQARTAIERSVLRAINTDCPAGWWLSP